MTDHSLQKTGHLQSVVQDWSDQKQAFHVPWGKLMMWIFLISDTFIFSCFLVGYMNVRMTTTDPWPYPSEVFALTLFGKNIPLILIAIMTFILITSSGTMALAVRYSHFRDKKKIAMFMFCTAALGASFVGMQAFEWTKLIGEGVRPWSNPFGAPQFGSVFFMVTGFHGLHVTGGLIAFLIVLLRVAKARRFTHSQATTAIVVSYYWHFVDVVWIALFSAIYLIK